MLLITELLEDNKTTPAFFCLVSATAAIVVFSHLMCDQEPPAGCPSFTIDQQSATHYPQTLGALTVFQRGISRFEINEAELPLLGQKLKVI